jgi:hypothetical protein
MLLIHSANSLQAWKYGTEEFSNAAALSTDRRVCDIELYQALLRDSALGADLELWDNGGVKEYREEL